MAASICEMTFEPTALRVCRVLERRKASLLRLGALAAMLASGPAFADGNGKKWDAVFTLPGVLPVRSSRDHIAHVGEPLTVSPLIDGEPIAGVGVCVTASLTGAGGEEYRNIAPAGARMAPGFSILDAEHVVVLQGRMEYGWRGYTYGCSCDIPEALVLTEIDYGVFDAVVTIETGPFAGTVTGSREIIIRR